MTQQHDPAVAIAQLGEAEHLITVLRDRTVALRYELGIAHQAAQAAQQEAETLRARVAELEQLGSETGDEA